MSQKVGTIRRSTIEKTAIFLKDLHDRTKNDYTKLGLNDLLSIHGLNHGIQKVLRDEEYVLFRDKGRNGMEYKWHVGEPNLAMAKIVLQKTNRLTNKKRENLIKRDNPKLWDEMVKGVNSLGAQTKTEIQAVPVVDMTTLKGMIDTAVKKALEPPVKIRKVLRLRNPFYWKTL